MSHWDFTTHNDLWKRTQHNWNEVKQKQEIFVYHCITGNVEPQSRRMNMNVIRPWETWV